MKIAVIGGGAAGMVAAWGLDTRHDVTLYEKAADLGGHVNTISTDGPDNSQTFDNGFVVYNIETYPIFKALLKKLGLRRSRAKMSLSISGGNTFTICEDVKQVFLANKLRIFDPRVPLLLASILRFHAIAKRDLKKDNIPDVTIDEYLKIRRLGTRIFDNYLGPVASAVWVGSPDAMRNVPAKSFIKFFHHHNMLGFRKFKWFTVMGGAAQYIDALAATLTRPPLTDCAATRVTRTEQGIEVKDSTGGSTIYDHLVFACHADTALELLANPTAPERDCLGTFQFINNRSFCHRDTALMPENKRTWSSWNCHYKMDPTTGKQNLSINYFLNSLHKVDRSDPVFLTIFPHQDPRPELIIREYNWSHVLYDKQSIAAQKQLLELQGKDRIWYAGAWRGYGFHEDAIGTGLTVARDLGCEFPDLPQWQPPDW